ncbi:hypothetical protein KO561_03125 [Radiobacillus kanasensis]|uniref:hypothetical protein n=1 Tax=Radiobacillus kanasensis TaxID=2844358 RepID=UPI001E3AB33C|nr:hypothetical protein [Radiobacillus kanasensis]UFT99969.1 hypothetical protein KO561_03125 [Radiobacillus kanasensis]
MRSFISVLKKSFVLLIVILVLAGCLGKSQNQLTEAPDLLKVNNFRMGPSTQSGPTTAVDFTFDQTAFLNGGDRSNFHLIPLDGGDTVDGSTNVKPQNDKAGDDIITVLFSGELNPENYARGYVDSQVVNSDSSNTSPDNPLNINQAAAISNEGKTENPDLVNVTLDGNSYLFEFDEALTDDDIIQNSSGLRLYFPEAKQSSTIPSAGSSRVEVVNNTTLRAYYEGTIPGDYALEDAVGAYVVQGTVQSVEGSRGANSGKNSFDETR